MCVKHAYTQMKSTQNTVLLCYVSTCCIKVINSRKKNTCVLSFALDLSPTRIRIPSARLERIRCPYMGCARSAHTNSAWDIPRSPEPLLPHPCNKWAFCVHLNTRWVFKHLFWALWRAHKQTLKLSLRVKKEKCLKRAPVTEPLPFILFPKI